MFWLKTSSPTDPHVPHTKMICLIFHPRCSPTACRPVSRLAYCLSATFVACSSYVRLWSLLIQPLILSICFLTPYIFLLPIFFIVPYDLTLEVIQAPGVVYGKVEHQPQEIQVKV